MAQQRYADIIRRICNWREKESQEYDIVVVETSNEEFEWPENTVRLHGCVVDAHASLYVSEVVYLMCTAEVLIKQNFSIQ